MQAPSTSALARFVDSHGRALVVVFLSLALAGLLFLFRIPVSIFPQTDFPRIIILVNNGIAPVDLQMLTVTRPIEEAVRIVPGIENVRSVTSRGSSEISVYFRWDIDILHALHLVQGRIAQILPNLPPDSRFYINRMTFSVFPTVGFSMTSPTRTSAELWEKAYYEIAPRLYRLPGVAETRIVGGRAPEYHVVVDPEKLNSFGLPLSRVTEAIRKTNLIGSAGMIQENYKLYLTTVTGLLKNQEQIENVVVGVVKGTPVLVKNLAYVTTGERPAYTIVTADGLPAVLVNVLQQPDGNAVEIADAVNRELREIQKALPPDIKVGVFYDQSVLVRDAITSVTESILIGLGLSIAVLVGFLKNWRTTLVASLVIPVAVLIAIIIMKLFNMSFNLMTLGGIAACIGVVIDDAIVMVENIVVHLSMGQTPREAAMSAIQELTPALIGSTLTPIVVFLPLVFLGGITAVFFRALAMTLVSALAASLFLAIFLTPVLARVFFRAPRQIAGADIHAAEQAGEGLWMRWLTDRYAGALSWCLGHTGIMMLVSVAIFGGSVALYLNLGSGFLPEMDEGAFVGDYRMPEGTSLEETNRVLMKVEQILKETPEIESYSRRTGARLALATAEPNFGDFLVKLKRKRTKTAEEVIDSFRGKIAQTVPVLEIEFAHILEDLIADLVASPQPIEIKVFHPDDATYKRVAKDITEWLPKVNGVADIVNRTVIIGPAHNFRVNLQKASLAGFGVQDVLDLESSIIDGQAQTNMIRGDRLIGIRVRYPKDYRASTDRLKGLLLTSPTGQTVPLSSIADLETDEVTHEIRRDNLRNMSAVTARLSGRDLGTTMDEIKRRIYKEVKIPPGADIEFGGQYIIQQESFQGLTTVLLMSMLLIFVILVFEFRSFSHPIAILAATILCGSGSLLALQLTHTTLNISSFMGAIMVIGIVHKNGILMLDSEKDFTAKGLPLREAIFEAGRRRLRPILMTALAAVFGMLPLALGVGTGAQILQPLAIAVIGGVLVSMVLSLLITPVLFFKLRQKGI